MAYLHVAEYLKYGNTSMLHYEIERSCPEAQQPDVPLHTPVYN